MVHDFKDKKKLERQKFFIHLICSISVALFLFVFLLGIFNSSVFATSEYLTQTQVNEFICAYNTFFDVNLPTSLDIKNANAFSMGISRDIVGSHGQVIYYLFLYKGKSAITQGGGSARAFLKEKGGTSAFYRFKFENNKWTSMSNSSSVEFTDGYLMVADTLPIVETSNCIFYKYSFTSGAISKQIGEIQQQITIINNNYNVLNEQVSAIDNKVNDLQNENVGVSQKLDTVIDNQQIINNNISSTGNQISQHLDTVNTSINNQGNQISSDLHNINNSITTVPDDLTDNTTVTSDDIKNSLDFQFTVDPYANFWEHLVNGLQDSFINKNQIFNINWLDGKTYEINVNDVIPAYPLAFKQLLTMVSTTVFAFPILKYIKKTVDLISSGSADELLEMNEEEGYIDMF